MKDIHWGLSTILKTSNKRVWSNVFWYVKVCIFWMCIQYTIHWDKTHIKKIPSDKINGTKNALFFLSWAPTYHSFTFNLRFLYELKHKVCLSITVCGIFRLRSAFTKVYIFFNKMHGVFDFKRHNPFQNWNNRKATHSIYFFNWIKEHPLQTPIK